MIKHIPGVRSGSQGNIMEDILADSEKFLDLNGENKEFLLSIVERLKKHANLVTAEKLRIKELFHKYKHMAHKIKNYPVLNKMFTQFFKTYDPKFIEDTKYRTRVADGTYQDRYLFN